MPISFVIPTLNVTKTAEYPFTDKRDQRSERVLWSDSYGCIIDNAAAAFTQVRETHRKLGWKRAMLDEQGNKTGAIEYVEGLHLIISFADDELDPTNPEDWERCGTLARKVAREQFPGYQFVLAVQADGESGKLHAHIVVNSVAFEDAIDEKGYVRRAGRVMGGWVTNIEVIRARVDAVSAEMEIKQNLPTYEPSKPVERGVSRTDRQLKRRGERSQRDVCRDLVDELILDGVSADELPEKMSEHGWSMEYRVKASGKSKGAEFTKFKHVDDARGMSATGRGGSSDLGLGYTREGIERRVRERALELEQERLDAEAEAQRVKAESEATPVREQVVDGVALPPTTNLDALDMSGLGDIDLTADYVPNVGTKSTPEPVAPVTPAPAPAPKSTPVAAKKSTPAAVAPVKATPERVATPGMVSREDAIAYHRSLIAQRNATKTATKEALSRTISLTAAFMMADGLAEQKQREKDYNEAKRLHDRAVRELQALHDATTVIDAEGRRVTDMTKLRAYVYEQQNPTTASGTTGSGATWGKTSFPTAPQQQSQQQYPR